MVCRSLFEVTVRVMRGGAPCRRQWRLGESSRVGARAVAPLAEATAVACSDRLRFRSRRAARLSLSATVFVLPAATVTVLVATVRLPTWSLSWTRQLRVPAGHVTRSLTVPFFDARTVRGETERRFAALDVDPCWLDRSPSPDCEPLVPTSPGPLKPGGGAAVVNDHVRSWASGLPARSAKPAAPPLTVAVYVVAQASGDRGRRVAVRAAAL